MKSLERMGSGMEEFITFGSSDLDRGGAVRGKPDEIAALLALDTARVLAIWRGKVLKSGDGLVWLPVDHPVLALATEAPVFLSQEETGPRFAQDISRWVPHQDAAEMGSFIDTTTQHHPDAPEGADFYELKMTATTLTRRDAELAASARSVLQWHEFHRFCANCGEPTQITAAGWQRACAACGRLHFPRTDPVVIMAITHGNSILMGRGTGWPEGFYSLLAGFIEPGETMEGAVRREVFEEAGVRVGPVSYAASQPWPYPSSLMLGCRGEAISTEINIDPHEILDARWVTREDMALVFAGAHPELSEPRRGSIAHALIEAWLADRLP